MDEKATEIFLKQLLKIGNVKEIVIDKEQEKIIIKKGELK